MPRGSVPAPRRVVALALAALLALAACGNVGSAAPAPTPPAPPPRLATVAGTGQFGLNIRQLPGLQGQRLATVPDGYQAAVVSGPVQRDGITWYKLRGGGVTGWASAGYLTISSGTPAPRTSTPTASIATASSAHNPPGVLVEAALQPAVDRLGAAPTGDAVLRKAAGGLVRITVAHLPSASEGGEFTTLGHAIRIADSVMKESVDVQATVLAHELQHAADILVDHDAPDSSQACINLELRAFQTQEKVWLELTRPSPAHTPMESELDQLSHVVNTPAFAQQLGVAYASECSVYSKS
ncbi:MAG: SH3 domain-containing protein [Chloroflexota bacterium]